jgi:putative PIN family toxin of toxin-antitoxin system
VIRAVLDTNVLVSAVLVPHSDVARVLDCWRDRLFVLLLSPALLVELGEVLRYPRLRRRHRWTDTEVGQFVDGLATMAVVVPGQVTGSLIEADPDDDAVIACAIEGSANAVVTGDQHLLALGEVQGVHIVTPRQFLNALGAV